LQPIASHVGLLNLVDRGPVRSYEAFDYLIEQTDVKYLAEQPGADLIPNPVYRAKVSDETWDYILAQFGPADAVSVAAAIFRRRKPEGRESELTELRAFATSNQGYLWLVGSPFAGKTILTSYFVFSCPREVDCVGHWLSARSNNADAQGFLGRVNTQLAKLLEVEAQPQHLESSEMFSSFWKQATDRAKHMGRHLLLVVDGLDEDFGPARGQPSVAALLPTHVGGHAHVLVSSRRSPQLPHDVAIGHPLHQATLIELAPTSLATDLKLLALRELDSVFNDRDGEILLGLLSAADGPLSIDDLTTLARLEDPKMQRVRTASLVEHSLARVLELIDHGGTRRYRYAHEVLHERSKALFDADLAEYRKQLYTWADSYHQRGWPANTPHYLFDTYPAMIATHAPERLGPLYSDIAYLESAIKEVRSFR
jgi:hypothetical protein